MEFPVDALKNWFLEKKRSFPWREDPTPYKVWISEVMLQQTQASVVIPYFARWMEHFPTIMDLANSSFEEVIKAWEGLGYYQRARHLHEGAKQIVKQYGGKIPDTPQELSKIKGIGPYTCGAILSFAFHQKAPCCDGNVYRLLSRFFAIDDPIDHVTTQKKIWKKAETILPEKEPWIISEALIECGATVCQKDPNCGSCPIRSKCRAFELGKTGEIPKKAKIKEVNILHRIVFVVRSEEEWLLQKGVRGKVMGELYEFPYAETKDLEEALVPFEREVGKLTYIQALPIQQHTFTHFRAFLYPHLFHAETREKNKYIWRNDLHSLPFSSGHRRILQGL